MQETFELLVFGFVAVLFVLVVGPLAVRFLGRLPTATGMPGGKAHPPGRRPALPAQPAPEAEPAAAPDGPPRTPRAGASTETIDVSRIEGRVKASSVKKVGEIVEKHPEEAVSIIRTWMQKRE